MYSPNGWIARSATNEGADCPVVASYLILRGEGRRTRLPSFAKQRSDFCIGSIGVNDPHPWAVLKAKALHLIDPLGCFAEKKKAGLWMITEGFNHISLNQQQGCRLSITGIANGQADHLGRASTTHA